MSYADHGHPTLCVLDGKPIGPDSNGVCPSCWKLIQKPLATIKASRASIKADLASAPEGFREDMEENGDLTQPKPAFDAMLAALWHAGMATEYGASAISTVAERVDEGKLVVAAAYNLILTLGYKEVAATLLGFQLGGPKALIRFRDTGKGTTQVHTPYDEKWNSLARQNRKIFFVAPEKEGEGSNVYWWRTFHNGDLRQVANLLQGVFGDQLTLGMNGKLFALPSMPLPKEEDFGQAPTGKPKATNEKPDIPDEIEGIRIGDRIKVPGGGESIVQYIDPRKNSIGVGDTKGGLYIFHSFEVIETLNGRAVAARINAERQKAAAEVRGAMPQDLVLDRDIPVGMKNYQIVSVAFVEKNRRVILGDEQGLGKSAVAITCIDTPAIIVCPATLKANWVKQMERWRPDLASAPLPLVVSGGGALSAAQLKRASVIVLNYEIVEKHLDALIKFGARTLIADEAHYLKNLSMAWDKERKEYVPSDKSPRRAKAFWTLSLSVPKLILATGTPVMNRTKELFPLLHLCNRKEWASQTEFQKRYCGAFETQVRGKTVWDASGRTNSSELHKRIKKAYLVRHTKAMVLTELSPKMRESQLVPLSEKWLRAYVQASKDFLDWVTAYHGSARAARSGRAEALARLTALRRISANGKVIAALEWIERHLESTGFRPLIVMGIHADAFESLGKGLDAINRQFDADVAAGEMPSISRKIKWDAVVGSTGLAKRVAVCDRFQGDPEVLASPGRKAKPAVPGVGDVLLFSIPLATGLTLTRSQDMLFLERLWRPADQVQAEDRIHRLGQTGSVQITYLDGVGTVDQKIGLLLLDKTDTAAQVIDGKELTHDEAFAQVFGTMFNEKGKKMNPALFQAIGDLSDLMSETEAEAIGLGQTLAELVKARKEMESQMKELAKIKAKSEGMKFEDALEEIEPLDDDIEEFARKLKLRGRGGPGGVTPNRFASAEDFDVGGELWPGHAADHAHYLRMKRENPRWDEVLDSLVADSWNQPLGDR